MKTGFLKRGSIFACLLAAILCGCGPSASQLAEQHARQNFQEAVAAVKVCTQGSTYKEFREKRLALETSYAANQSALADKAKTIDQLVLVMQATDCLWNLQIQIHIQFPNFVPEESNRSELAEAMKIIKVGSGSAWEQIKSEHDFPDNYVRRGLTLISKQCDELLARGLSELAGH